MKINKMQVFMLLIPLITVHIYYATVYGLNAEETPKVVALILNRVDFQDLYSMPQMRKLIQEGSIGLMNTRASGSQNEFKSYATLGWGTRAEAGENTSTFYSLGDENTAVYERRIGKIAKDEGIINTNINVLIQQNIRGEYGAVPGILGDLLRQHGYKTALLGNSDVENNVSRPAGFIPMDSNGYIDYGNVDGSMVEEDMHRPFGMKTNYDQLLEDFKELYAKGDFIVIETGDINRLERYKNYLNAIMYQEHKKNILAEIDAFIEKILIHADGNPTVFMLVTPFPSDAAIQRGERLTPIIIHDGINKGLLWSGTTRREGIVGNVDFAPTVLSYFHISSSNMVGREMSTVKATDTINYILKLNSRVVNTSQQRYRILYSFAIYEIIASAIALLAIIFRKKISYKWHLPIALGLLSNIIAPFTLLVLPLFGVLSIVSNYFLFVVSTIFFVCIVYLLGKKQPLDIILCASSLIVAGLMIDIITGQSLIKNSVLGYDPIIGARYYGVGNEYMGIFIGAILIFTTTLIERYSINKYFILLFYLITTMIIAFPTFGANVGGTITAVFAFLFTSVRLLNKKISFKKLLYILVAVIIVVAAMAMVDLFFIENQSHLASAVEQIFSSGPVVIYQIVVRKISMNIRVMGVTVWSKVLLSAIVILGILFYRPVGIIKKITITYSYMAIGWSGIIVAGIIAFAVNDSGVVSAATAIIFLTTTMLYSAMDLLKQEEKIGK
ncbi:hypothetical protein [Clostridium formicaceticum]|uniref:Uncharacterized protein n=1 Tax=Clostridium formicaceticum TaxID=1497 RepID=A0AAC9RLF4_9CLOT|nr:hypothetical protein [Clostridium formicaceticum]AOY77001.1 hypothetical protein BJL90_14735 [Clostridium formicaceticum]ARE87490.1 hypothetical protein CLFO_18900 [Clostridium formicaceticum]